LKGANYDLLELGGGDASTTVISPDIFNEFVAPCDAELIEAAHQAGQRVVYHTCGGMMPILEDIAAMKPDAMETFTPPAMGGDVHLKEAKRRIGDKVCMIGGLDQFHYFTGCTPAETRKAVFAGKGYEANPEMLKAQLTGYFTQQGGPGLPDEGADKKVLKGFVAPHIDFTRGGTCYAHAYKALGESNYADVFCILGTCHTPMQNPFAFTLKSFETPLGIAEVAKDIVEDCAERLPFDPFHDEFSHRTEHAIEFQVIFLQYLLGEREFTNLSEELSS